jgi:hypothetical protein
MYQTQLPNNLSNVSSKQENRERIPDTIADPTKEKSDVDLGIELLIRIKSHEKLHLLLNDNCINDKLKLKICCYFIDQKVDFKESIDNVIYNIIKKNSYPKEPEDLDDIGKSNWNNFWKIAVTIATSCNTQPVMDITGSFTIHTKDVLTILLPSTGSYSITFLQDKTVICGQVITCKAILDTIRDKKAHLIMENLGYFKV